MRMVQSQTLVEISLAPRSMKTRKVASCTMVEKRVELGRATQQASAVKPLAVPRWSSR